MNSADELIRRRVEGLPRCASRPGGLHSKALWAVFGLTALLGLMELPGLSTGGIHARSLPATQHIVLPLALLVLHATYLLGGIEAWCSSAWPPRRAWRRSGSARDQARSSAGCTSITAPAGNWRPCLWTCRCSGPCSSTPATASTPPRCAGWAPRSRRATGAAPAGCWVCWCSATPLRQNVSTHPHGRVVFLCGPRRNL